VSRSTTTTPAHRTRLHPPRPGTVRRDPATVRVVVSDARPVVRAGLAALFGGDGPTLAGSCHLEDVASSVARLAPDLLVVGLRENDPETLGVAAAAKAVRKLRVMVVADAATVLDLREAVVAGVDSFLLSSAPMDEIRDAAVRTASGERIVSPSIAMQLAGTWRQELPQGGASTLTPRELEVLQLLAEGLTNQQIGTRLGMATRTVKTHVQHLLGKLDVPDRTGAVARAFRLGLIR
jgi:DNA-binding NarL/FixJ family response regulator